ncbi:MAG: zinc ribbon domain-containing protein [Nitrospirota bacterium]
MPIYEYQCEDCREYFALFQHMSPPKGETECPKCSSKKVKKLVSSFSCSTEGGCSTGGSFSGGFSGGG